jgi:uncharacterized membrane protein
MEVFILRRGSINKWLFFTIFLILIISIIPQTSTAQEKEITDEIDHDWSTDVILIYVETPNKFDRTYGTNITSKNVLDEISSIEEALNPQKEDHGEVDDVTFILSISSLIKELNLAPKNMANAVVDELKPATDPGEPPGDHEYTIPEDQDEIDILVSDIPTDTRETLVRDTNDDGIWDSAEILIGVTGYSQKILHEINELIDKYYIDPEASDSDFNSEQSWWSRIIRGEVHCTMTNLGYVESYEDYYEAQDSINLALTITVLSILVGLLIVSLLMIRKHMKKGNNEDQIKKKMLTVFLVFVILIIANISMGLLKTSAAHPDKLDQFSSEFDGGEMGLILIRGSPSPPDDQALKGSGSMKDIEVLDSIERLERDLESLNDREGRALINPPITIVDVMKLIHVTENMVNQIPRDSFPDSLQLQIDGLANTSFWDAIHTAGEFDSTLWFIRYGKSMQDSFINIFYNTITMEMRRMYVNEDYSKSLFYLQIPIGGEGETDLLKSRISDVIHLHQPFIPISNVVSVNTGAINFQNIAFAVKITILFIILTVGIIFFLLTVSQIRKLDKNESQKQAVFPKDGEAIFEDITDED